jgi:uncharacterized tellurite resistance protein B-like protein
MQTAIVIFFALLVAAAAVGLGYMNWEYRHWPPYLWKQRLRRRLAELRDRRDDLESPARGQDPTAQLHATYFRRHLQGVPLEKLIDFPGIGPGTVDRLRQAGRRSLADAVGSHFDDVPGVGRVRAKDLRAAVRELVRQAQSRFDAGATPEAHEYRRQLDALRAGERERALARDRQLAAVEEALREADELDDLAADVTFRAYLFHRHVPGLTDEVLDRPLPTPRERPAPVARPAPAPVPPPAPVAAAVRAARPVAPAVAVPPPPPPDLFRDPPRPQEPHPWLAKMRAYARFAFAVARADGRVAQAERRAIRAFLDEQFGHDGVLVRHIDPLMEQTEANPPAEADALADVRPVTTDAERRELYRLAGRITDATGERSKRERGALDRIAAAFELTEATPPPAPPRSGEGSKAEGPPSPPSLSGKGAGGLGDAPHPRAVLEIPAGADLSPELIRRRYAHLTDRLDPAKAATLGADVAAVVAGKRAAVRAAAEALIAPFGVPLDPPAAPPPPADLRHNPDLDDVFGA